MLSLKVEQDNKYEVIESSNSDEEYKIISSNINDELSENQKTSLLVTINKFYSEIQLMKKDYSSEL